MPRHSSLLVGIVVRAWRGHISYFLAQNGQFCAIIHSERKVLVTVQSTCAIMDFMKIILLLRRFLIEDFSYVRAAKSRFQSYLYFSQHFSGGSSKQITISGGACFGFSMIDFSAHRRPPEILRPDLKSDTLGLQVGCETLTILENSKNYEIQEEYENPLVPVKPSAQQPGHKTSHQPAGLQCGGLRSH